MPVFRALQWAKRLTHGVILLSCMAGGAAYASEADAVAISRNIQSRHLPWGTIADPVFASAASNQIVNYTRCGDSAIWTGYYLAAEAYRYSVTGSAEALGNIKGAVAGIQALVDVTGTNLLARCRVPLGSPYAPSILLEEGHNGVHTNAATGYYWIGNTSRDQYCGVFFGLSVAWDMVSDPGLRASISMLVSRMLDFLVANGWNVVMPDGTLSTTFFIRPDQQLTLLQIGRHVTQAAYPSTYDSNALVLAAAVVAPVAIEVQDNGSYFKFNLDYINFFNLIRLEKNLVWNLAYQPAYGVLRSHT